jgi:glutathione S-transferase
MEPVALVTLIALLEYVVFGILVGRARGKYGVKAPAVHGHEIFERYFRVHYNTLELMVAFVPSMWLFGTYVSPDWAALLGLVYVVGRIAYIVGYVADPSKRELGFGLSVMPILVLLCGGLWGVAQKLI